MNKSKSIIGSCLFILIIGICVASALGVSIFLGIQNRTTHIFGAPADHLSVQQRFYLALQLLLQEKHLLNPAQLTGDPQPLHIELGENTTSVLQRLEQAGLISSANALRTYLVYKGMDTTLQAGDYQISAKMTPIEIAYALQDAVPSSVKFNILAGWRLEEIAKSLPTSGVTISPDEFMVAVRSGTFSLPSSYSVPDNASLEGFLSPDVYQFRRDVPVNEFINTMLSNFDQKLTKEIREGVNRQGLTIFEGVILASIVEREAVLMEEMPSIASVFLNRLAIDMKLDSDPTVQYAIGYNPSQKTWWTNPLSRADLLTDSPYNTYLYPDLPPGPIANPSLEALHAVAFPAQTPYYYFRATCDNSGRHRFAETFQEHLQNACP